MGRYVLTREIHATAPEVFTAFTDPVRSADWLNAAGIRDIRGRLDTAGTTYTLVVRGPWRFKVTVVRSVPPTVHETFLRGPLGASARISATLLERDGITQLEVDTEYTVPFGPLGRLIDRRWFERLPRTQANREIDRLVAIVMPQSV